MKCLVTGGAGFIGSTVVRALLEHGHEVVVYDNFSSGRREFLEFDNQLPPVEIVEADLLDIDALQRSMFGIEVVWHIAANPDIRYGAEKTDLDLHQGTLATYNVLEAMRQTEVERIIFSSSSAVYGLPSVFPTPEEYGPLLPHSLYGASKLACEGLIAAYCHSFGFQAWMYRFANVVGPNSTHGILFDFLAKLRVDSSKLEVLGNGHQQKSYIHVQDCVEGMLHGWKHGRAQINLFNLSPTDDILISRIAEIVLEEAGNETASIIYTGGEIGWTGDIPVMKLDNTRLTALGWVVKRSSEEAVRQSVKALVCKQ